MEDFEALLEDHYLKYASYVILDRAIPRLEDGLKPVQRRILWTLWTIDDGKLHKVANVAGQTMALHPHGDAAIVDALTNLANKGFLLDRQGNFGNPFTGDPAAAARYIETRLSPLAKETLFNPDLMVFAPSYDGRREEPMLLSAKIPLLLLQGVDGIAVGMATHIFPHNFVEVLEAEIATIEGKKFSLLPDFPTGGTLDPTDYEDGKGKIKVRARIDIKDPKTLAIKEICYGTTTESLIRSIDEAAKKGHFKLESIHDFTSEEVEIEIKLPRGVYAEEIVDALYHFTECQVTLHAQPIVIKDDLPHEVTLTEMVQHHADQLERLLKRELEIEEGRLKEKIFAKTLEAIFIEEKIYKKLEPLKTDESIHTTIEKSFVPYEKEILRLPNKEDRDRLLSLPIRRITLHDQEKNRKDRDVLEKELAYVRKNLKEMRKVTVNYLKDLIKRYGKDYPRKSRVGEIVAIDTRKVATKSLKVGFDSSSGFLGLTIQGDKKIECTNFDKILLIFNDGSYRVISIPEKQYVLDGGKKLLFVGIADKKTSFCIAWRDPKTKLALGKRFIVDKFILDKEYHLIDSGSIDVMTSDPNATIVLHLVPKPKQKMTKIEVPIHTILVKGVAAKGIRLASRPVSRMTLSGEEKDLFA
jgi:topoisomerase-4 subunit A